MGTIYNGISERISQVANLTQCASDDLMKVYNQYLDAPDAKIEICPTEIYRIASTLRLVADGLDGERSLLVGLDQQKQQNTMNSAA